MTKKEFKEKFASVCLAKMDKFTTENVLSERIHEYANENGSISTEQLAIFAFTESILYSQDLLKDVLESVLEFDE